MKNIKTCFTLTLLFFLVLSCKKEIPGCNDYSADNYNSEATYDDGSCQYSGDVVFYIDQPINKVDVNFNGQLKTISLYYNYIPNCGDAGCATFHAPVGTYWMTAQEQGVFGSDWEGWVNILKNDCNKVLLNP